LGVTDFATAGGNVGIKRHILPLEGRNSPILAGEETTKGSRQEGFASVGGSSHYHYCFHGAVAGLV
jgi:hypothetical protein